MILVASLFTRLSYLHPGTQVFGQELETQTPLHGKY